MKKLLQILLFILFSTSFTFSQEEITDIVSTDEAYSEDFSIAIEMYKQMLSFDKESPVFNFKLGFCYLNTVGKEDSSIIYFRNAAELYEENPIQDITPNEINFYLAKSYRINNKFDSAIIVLENLKRNVKDDSFKILIRAEILLAQDKLNDYGSGVSMDIKNLGEIINSSYSEHSPVFSEDKTILMFTSRKSSGSEDEILSDGQYDEDIYYARKIDGVWSKPEPISDNINTSDNEATVGLSPDGNTLFIYKSENQGTIYKTEYIDDEWSVPQKLGKNVNTKNRETHASITRDGKYLYFTSDRFGGFGGLDIYVSELQTDGDWGKPTNLGPAVNTEADEDGPYIRPDGNLLYFSSEGHQGYGGFDIYKTEKNEFETWTLAENIGYPINSIEDDAFYCPINDESALFTSRKDDGFGQMDLYLLTTKTIQEDSITVMTAFLEGCQYAIPYTTVNIKDNTTGKKYIATPNDSGKFIFVTYKGNNYNLTLIYENNEIYYDNFDVPLDCNFTIEYKVIDISDLISCE